jgi:putative flippase GtrA
MDLTMNTDRPSYRLNDHANPDFPPKRRPDPNVVAMRTGSAAHWATVVQFFRFGTVGFFGFLVDVGFFHLGLDILDLGHYASAFFSFPFTVTFTWAGNRLFTFRGKDAGSVGSQWMRFFLVSAVGLALNRGTFVALTASASVVYAFPILGLLGGTAAGMFFNFFVSRRVVFR